jgi:hypothetical protein
VIISSSTNSAPSARHRACTCCRKFCGLQSQPAQVPVSGQPAARLQAAGQGVSVVAGSSITAAISPGCASNSAWSDARSL